MKHLTSKDANLTITLRDAGGVESYFIYTPEARAKVIEAIEAIQREERAKV